MPMAIITSSNENARCSRPRRLPIFNSVFILSPATTDARAVENSSVIFSHSSPECSTSVSSSHVPFGKKRTRATSDAPKSSRLMSSIAMSTLSGSITGPFVFDGEGVGGVVPELFMGAPVGGVGDSSSGASAISSRFSAG